jgi:N-acetylglucosaminyldiphosphoundecaprenol N-acetyl-beta-D-mannosaminyltransferase
MAGDDSPRHAASRTLFGVPFCLLGMREAVQSALSACLRKAPCRQIVFVNAYSICLARQHARFLRVLREADQILPDGFSIVWAARILKVRMQERVAGPDYMLELLAQAKKKGLSSFFLGGKNEQVLEDLRTELTQRFGEQVWAGGISPPFGNFSPEYEDSVVEAINRSGASILWVGLGSPKQDIFIDSIKPRLKLGIAAGVGAAFDFHSNNLYRAPPWMQSAGLEWLVRLCADPRRLWKRYLLGNPRFLALLAKEYVLKKRFNAE